MTEHPAHSGSSVHYRRRWYYALWVGLLAVSLAALVAWEVPGAEGEANLDVSVLLEGAPAGVTVQGWVGPERMLGRIPWSQIPVAGPGAGGLFEVRGLKPRVATRRWVPDLMLRRTDTNLVLRFQPSGQPERFLSMSLLQDWRTGLLRNGRSMGLRVTMGWSGLGADPRSVLRESAPGPASPPQR